MLSLLYVSRSSQPPEEAQNELQAILAVSADRNMRSGITGALVHTGREFAQVLEGPDEAVVQVMGNIILDRRHKDVRILVTEQIEARSFPNWGMAQIVPSISIQAAIDAIRHAGDDAELDFAVERLTSWMREGASARV
jgi:hypothetical protein